MTNTLDWILGVVGVVLVGFLGLVIWSRRGAGRPDPPGVRTVCEFHGALALASDRERAAASSLGPGALGDALSERIAEGLRRSGVEVLARDRENYGWGVSLMKDGVRANLQVGVLEAESDTWLLQISDASSGGPGPDDLLPLVDRALHDLDGLSEIRWHPRQDLARYPWPPGSDKPLDRA